MRIDSQSRVSLAKHVATRQHTLAAAALLTALRTALERLEDVRVRVRCRARVRVRGRGRGRGRGRAREERLEDAREEGRVVLHLGHHPAERGVLVGVPG